MSVPPSRGHVMLCVLVSLLCLSLTGLFQAQSEQGVVVLLTEEEAARFRLTEEQFESLVEYVRETLSLGESDQPGPRIEFRSPDLIDGVVIASTPHDLSVAFKPNLAPVNGQSLKVFARRGTFRMDLTDRVLPYLVPDGDGGWGFVMESAVIPRGRFHIEIEIADRDKEWTVQNYFFQITRKN